jgi:predicted RNase H-like HicB family nuclease
MPDLPLYSYMVFWSPEDGEYVATCVELPGLTGLASTERGALDELKTAIGVWLRHLAEEGLAAPEPTSGAVFSVCGTGVRLEGSTVCAAPESSTYCEDDNRIAL